MHGHFSKGGIDWTTNGEVASPIPSMVPYVNAFGAQGGFARLIETRSAR